MAAHPPPPGPVVQPNFLEIMDAVGGVAFPISKRELLDHVGEATVLFQGRNASMHDLIKEIHDDYFESDDELLEALELHYTTPDDETEPTVAPLAEVPESPWRGPAGPDMTLGDNSRE